jgi:hypothetical protein
MTDSSGLEIDPHGPFREMLEQSRQRLDEVTAHRDESLRAAAKDDAEIVHLRRVIVSLAAMLGEATQMESIGITDAVRVVMKTANIPLRLRNVCERLSESGFDAHAQENLSASVQSVLNRITEKAEIEKEQVDIPGGKSVLVYIGPNVTKVQRRQTIQSIKNGEP